MEMYVDALDNEYWSARNSMGYSWMVSTGVPQVEDLIDKDTDVIILMGVNDLGNLYNYADYINEKAAIYTLPSGVLRRRYCYPCQWPHKNRSAKVRFFN